MKRFDMDVDTHEAVWTLGARAAREARGKLDLDGAFIAAVRKYGTKVFPAAKGHEDDPWFEAYFQAFRDGAEAAGVNESTMAMRSLIRQLEEGKADRPVGRGDMQAYDWAVIASELGGTLVKRPTKTQPAVIRRQNDTLEFVDNGGEINISKRVTVGESVPFWSNAHPGGSVGPRTLAYRLTQELVGRPIDYDKDVDPEPKEKAGLKDAITSEWVAQNLAMLAANFAQRKRGPAKAWHGDLAKVLSSNGIGPLGAKQLSLFDEAYEQFMEAYASAGGQDLNVIERITKDITNRALALVRAS